MRDCCLVEPGQAEMIVLTSQSEGIIALLLTTDYTSDFFHLRKNRYGSNGENLHRYFMGWWKKFGSCVSI